MLKELKEKIAGMSSNIGNAERKEKMNRYGKEEKRRRKKSKRHKE